MDGVRKLSWIIVPVALWGCGKGVEAPFPDWIGELKVAHAREASRPNAALERAALRAEQLAGSNADRVSFTPGRADRLVAELAGPADEAVRAVRDGGLPQDRFGPPFRALPFQRGWRMIGRVLVWRIERGAAREEFADAAAGLVDAARFGLALTAGSATDASLGYSILEEAASAFVAAEGRLSHPELRSLGSGLEAVLARKPGFEPMIQQETLSMRHAVQAVQDAFRDRKLGVLLEKLGKEVEPAIDALERIQRKGTERRVAYFEAFAAESEIWADRYRAEFAANARQRANLPKLEWNGDRPWRRFSKHFFTALAPLPTIRDRAVCRIRLIALQSLILAECRANGEAPSSLVGISAALTTDPYSGRPFEYRPDGAHFLLYSIGPDLKDDGGEDGADVLVDD